MKITVLIVEDEAIVAADLAGKLKGLGYEIVGVAAAGEEAVALAGRLRPDLVLMDISLEGPMDGIAAAEAIRRRHDVPVIYLTAHSDPATLARAKITDPFGYILKPFEERELATQIELALYKYEADQTLLTEILQAFNRGGELRPLIAETIRLIRRATGFDAVGLRLRQDDDCPYFAQDGFSEEFLREENLLCERGSDGAVLRDAAGLAVLQCTCGLILSGRTDHDMSCFTSGGSCWTNASHEFLALPPDADPRTHPRNRCIHCGYESVGLFPVRAGKPIIGLLQLNDHRPGRFTPQRIVFYEALALNIGLAIQRITAEAALQSAKAAAEAANVAKSQFLASMSHELRTPMNAILGMTELALGEQLPPTVRDYLQTSKDSAELLLELLNEILDFSRVEAGQFDLESTSFSVRKAVDQVAKTLGVRACEKGLELIYEVADDVPNMVVGDPLRLRQVLLNLVSNAIKFTPEGEVVLRVEVERKGEGVKGRRGEEQSPPSPPLPFSSPPFLPALPLLRFSVSDTGIGIAAEKLQSVFAPFTQADSSTTRRFGGTGLGLAISQRLVNLMGGHIEVESRLGQGSTFSFALALPLGGPAESKDGVTAANQDGFRDLPALVTSQSAKLSSADRTNAVLPVPSRSLRVLLAADTPANQKLVRHLLSKRGHTLAIAENGEQALDLLRRQDFDVVLMDVEMPEMDGFQATAELRKLDDERKARLPVIAMTAHALKGDRQRCLAAGMDYYLSKPIKAQELIDVIERLAGNGDT